MRGSDRYANVSDYELAQTMATIAERNRKMDEALADGRVADVNYYLLELFLALGDYLLEYEEWSVQPIEDQEGSRQERC